MLNRLGKGYYVDWLGRRNEHFRVELGLTVIMLAFPLPLPLASGFAYHAAADLLYHVRTRHLQARRLGSFVLHVATIIAVLFVVFLKPLIFIKIRFALRCSYLEHGIEIIEKTAGWSIPFPIMRNDDERPLCKPYY